MTTRMKALFVLSLLMVLPSCASIINGSSQTITISSTPACAQCSVFLQDEQRTKLADISCTPARITVERNKHDLDVVCAMQGLGTLNKVIASGFEEDATYNALLIAAAPIGLGADWATGALHHYPDQVHVSLIQEQPVQGK